MGGGSLRAQSHSRTKITLDHAHPVQSLISLAGQRPCFWGGDKVLEEILNWGSGRFYYSFVCDLGQALALNFTAPRWKTKVLDPTVSPALQGQQQDAVIAGLPGPPIKALQVAGAE